MKRLQVTCSSCRRLVCRPGLRRRAEWFEGQAGKAASERASAAIARHRKRSRSCRAATMDVMVKR